jgi:carbonic anhydrase
MSDFMSQQIYNEVLSANEKYASSFTQGSLALPPARGFAILSCMDARLDVAKYAGLNEGDAHVIRNAGGRATDDAIRSLVISHKLLGTNTFFVVHHSDCGMELFNDQIIGDLLENDLETANIDFATGKWSPAVPRSFAGSSEGKFIKWHTFTNLEASVIEDVKRIKAHALVPKNIPVFGFYYDVKTGKLVEVKEASEAGKAVN